MSQKLQKNKYIAFWMKKETKHVSFWIKISNPRGDSLNIQGGSLNPQDNKIQESIREKWTKSIFL